MVVNATTIDAFKDWSGVQESSDQDERIELLVNAVSRAIEAEINRELEKKERTVQFSIRKTNQVNLQLPHFPVDLAQTFEFLYAADRDFTASGLDVDADTYWVEADIGVIWLDEKLTPGNGVTRVKWTGGLATTDALFVASKDYANIMLAANMQIAHQLERRDSPGSTREVSAVGSAVFKDEVSLLKEVRTLLRPYRYVNYGS